MLHLRPVQFVDTPVGRDGEVARLAGGLQWFAAYEVIRGAERRTVPVAGFDDFAKALPDPQAERAALLAHRISAPRASIQAGERVLRFDQPQAMAILNLTPDSFSDGGRHDGDPAAAAAAGVDMAAAGAAIIDVGGESTRPGAPTVWEGDEIARVVPVIERLAASGTPVSIDTRKASVMEAALAAGAHIVNDVSALLYDDRAAEVVARAGVPVVLMHSADPKRGAEGAMTGGNALTDCFDWLEARIEAAVAAGVDRARIIVDPGIGFGKSLADNLAILNGLSLFHGLGCPLLLGASRKRIVGALSGEAPVGARLGGSVMLAVRGADQGAQWLRVHDVPETVQALRVWRGMRDAALVAR
ncbi:dihydropteroate synthase [Sphingomonas spermidinifaciens]|uniref:dihydropteroate synthase n=1 Tax=Sphingomonas spermidinifaciens TaxID=1141889 RepID=A0A2A4B3Q7_9SPHN|nr:dihydropteroate synthase [Sphingomonas spermidinifaciens]PCD02378.1 dihydropteroate synthase [Sphingomonas spermidinifaciens]